MRVKPTTKKTRMQAAEMRYLRRTLELTIIDNTNNDAIRQLEVNNSMLEHVAAEMVWTLK